MDGETESPNTDGRWRGGGAATADNVGKEGRDHHKGIMLKKKEEKKDV